MKTGLVMGKFYPPHKGHLALIEFAATKVDKVLVVVGDLPIETIPAELRVEWLKIIFEGRDNIEIVNVSDDNPSTVKSTDPEYYPIWAANLKKNLPYVPDVIIGSESYVVELALEMHLESILFDQSRTTVPISATQIRENPEKHWEMIPEVVKEYYSRKPKIFVISDTHWNHVNILKYENRPPDHVEQIIKNWNLMVRPNDLVIHLGDVIFAEDKMKNLTAILKRLNGKKVLCRGNHDYYPDAAWGGIDWFMEAGFDMVTDYFVYEDMAFSHAPLTPLPYRNMRKRTTPVSVNIHGHFHRSSHRIPKEGEDQTKFIDEFYDYHYYKAHESHYQLIQIEDELRPFSLEEVLRSWQIKINRMNPHVCE